MEGIWEGMRWSKLFSVFLSPWSKPFSIFLSSWSRLFLHVFSFLRNIACPASIAIMIMPPDIIVRVDNYFKSSVYVLLDYDTQSMLERILSNEFYADGSLVRSGWPRIVIFWLALWNLRCETPSTRWHLHLQQWLSTFFVLRPITAAHHNPTTSI